jgi:4-hydroxy-4-methyl-2-oxoglutarate aldolase
MSAAHETDLVARLGRLDVCTVSDALDALGLAGVVTGLRPLWEGARAVGRAVTMRLAEGPPPPGAPKVHLGSAAIEASGPQSVIVVDNEGRLGMGSWGGLLSLAASVRGVAGVVSDGACRDVDEARELRFPVFARGVVAHTARQRAHEASVGTPVRLVDTTVHPGDLILADGSGVVVVPVEDAERILETAERIASREAGMAADLRAGTPVSHVLGGSYEDMLSRKDAPS